MRAVREPCAHHIAHGRVVTSRGYKHALVTQRVSRKYFHVQPYGAVYASYTACVRRVDANVNVSRGVFMRTFYAVSVERYLGQRVNALTLYDVSAGATKQA